MRASKLEVRKIGVLGGTFDPPHIGHLEISKVALKKLKLSKLIWAVTKRNPLKKKAFFKLKKRITHCENMTRGFGKVKVKSFDNVIKSSKTIKLINYIRKNNKKSKIFFIMGSDNLVNFHKWHEWKKIADYCTIAVFPRSGFTKKAEKCKSMRYLGKEKILIIRSKRINISSSKIRENYLR